MAASRYSLPGNRSAWVGLVGNGAVTDGQDTHKAMPLVELVNDPVRPDTKRSEPAEAAPQSLARIRVSLQQTQSFIYCAGERPVEVEHLLSGSADELDPSHLPTAGDAGGPDGDRQASRFPRVRPPGGLPQWRPSSPDRKESPPSPPMPRTHPLGPVQRLAGPGGR